jgi:hypothetical protein
LSLEELLAKKKAEEEEKSKPKFFTKEECAAEAMRKQQTEIKNIRKQQEKERAKRNAFFRFVLISYDICSFRFCMASFKIDSRWLKRPTGNQNSIVDVIEKGNAKRRPKDVKMLKQTAISRRRWMPSRIVTWAWSRKSDVSAGRLNIRLNNSFSNGMLQKTLPSTTTQSTRKDIR